MARKKFIQFLIRADKHDADSIRKKVESSGLSQQEYLLKAALEEPIINSPVFRELLTEYKRQGNNINQLTRAVNSGRISASEVTEALDELEKERKQIWQLLNLSIQMLA